MKRSNTSSLNVKYKDDGGAEKRGIGGSIKHCMSSAIDCFFNDWRSMLGLDGARPAAPRRARATTCAARATAGDVTGAIFPPSLCPKICAGGSIIGDFSLQMLLSIPISAFWAWMITTYNFDWQDGMGGATFGVGTAFLLTMRVQTAYARYWEARGHIGTSIKCCRTTGILVVTQFHRHYGQPGSEVPKCVDDIRRYMMLYFYTMMLQVQGKSLNNSRLEQYLTQPELNLLQGRKNAAVVCVKWIASRLAHLESLGYMSPLQLHETNDALDGMIDAFNGLTKIKGTPIPFPIRQLCNILNTVYCYTIPLVFASKFASTYNEQLNIIGRTCLSAALISFAFFGINTTAKVLEDPLGDDDNDLPLMKFATGLHTELLTLFSDEIPPLVGQVGELTPAVPNGNGGGRRTSTKPSIVGTAPCRNSCEPSYVPRAGKLKQSDGGGVSFGQ
jgi:predicted membrane chloride channel (bestrophin family)